MAYSFPDNVEHFIGAGSGDLTVEGVVVPARTLDQAVTAGQLASGDLVPYVLEEAAQRQYGVAPLTKSGSVWTLERTDGEAVLYNGESAIETSGNGATVFRISTPERDLLRTQDLQANGGLIPTTDRTNEFTATQRLVSTAKTAGAALRSWVFRGLSSTDVARDYAEVQGKIITATNGSEDGALVFRGLAAGAAEDFMQVGPTGVALDGLTPPGSPGVIRARGYQDEFGNAIGQGAYTKLAEEIIPSGSPVSAVDFVTGIDATYGVYEIHLLNVVGPEITELRFSDDGGSTFEAGASDYSWQGYMEAAAVSAGDDALRVGNLGSTALVNGIIRIFNPADAGSRTTAIFDVATNVTTAARRYSGSGTYMTASAINGFRLLGSSTFHGKVQLFGRIA